LYRLRLNGCDDHAPIGRRDSFRWIILALITFPMSSARRRNGINTLAHSIKGLGLSRAQVGLFFSAFYLAMTGASFGAGWLADRWGVRNTTMQGHFFVGICIIAAAAAPSFAWVFASFFLAGLGYSFLNPASTIGVMAWFHRDERATAMGTKQTGGPAGGVLAAVLAPSLVLIIGWRGALAALGVINVLFAFVFSSSWREAPQGVADSSEPESAASAEPSARIYRALLPVSVATAIYLVGQMVLITYVPLYLKDAMGFSAYWSSQALALTQGGAMIGRVGWGVVSDRLFGGQRKVVLLLIGSLSALLVTALSFLGRESSYTSAADLISRGVCLVGYQGVSYALIGEIPASEDRR
jgi:sugar phosphate permease